MEGSRECYTAWIEMAERRLTEWLERDGDRDGAEPESIQLRDIASVVALIKALIEVRRRLETWQSDGEGPKTSVAGDTTDQEIFELMERCEPGAEDSSDEGEMPL